MVKTKKLDYVPAQPGTRPNTLSTHEWTDRTWNPWWGCDKIAPECDHCYAATFASRGLP